MCDMVSLLTKLKFDNAILLNSCLMCIGEWLLVCIGEWLLVCVGEWLLVCIGEWLLVGTD